MKAGPRARACSGTRHFGRRDRSCVTP